MKQPISFNGKELPEFVRVTGIEIPVTPDISPLTESVPRMFGEVSTGQQIKGGSFRFSVKLVLDKGRDIMQARDELAEWLRGDTFNESQLIFREQPDRYFLAKASGSNSIKDLFLYGEGSFQLDCSKLIKYDTRESVHTGKDKVSVKYESAFPTSPVITIKLSADHENIYTTHNLSQKRVYLTGKFPAGSVIEIDTARKIVKLNGQVNMGILEFKSEWMELVKGENVIVIHSSKSVSGSMDVTCKYFRKWY